MGGAGPEPAGGAGYGMSGGRNKKRYNKVVPRRAGRRNARRLPGAGNRLVGWAQDSAPPTAETTVQFYESMIELVGDTPLVKLNNVTRGIQRPSW